jgi:hypothetical protein
VLALFDGGNDDRIQSFNEAMALSTASSVEVGSSGSPHQGDRLMASCVRVRLARIGVAVKKILGPEGASPLFPASSTPLS